MHVCVAYCSHGSGLGVDGYGMEEGMLTLLRLVQSAVDDWPPVTTEDMPRAGSSFSF